MTDAVLGVDVGGTAIKSWSAAGAGPTVPTPKGDPSGERVAVAGILERLAAPVAAIRVAAPRGSRRTSSPADTARIAQSDRSFRTVLCAPARAHPTM
jgi:hypothetical protein